MSEQCGGPNPEPRCGLAAHVHLSTPALAQICGDGSPRLFIEDPSGVRCIVFFETWWSAHAKGSDGIEAGMADYEKLRNALIWLATGVWP